MRISDWSSDVCSSDLMTAVIDIFTTGGTIDKVYFDALSEFQIGTAAIPDMSRENNVLVPHRVTQLMRKDSLELDDADREAFRDAVAASDMARILVTHDTGRMVVQGHWLTAVVSTSVQMIGEKQKTRRRTRG